jgi:hypothetical protein
LNPGNSVAQRKTRDDSQNSRGKTGHMIAGEDGPRFVLLPFLTRSSERRPAVVALLHDDEVGEPRPF